MPADVHHIFAGGKAPPDLADPSIVHGAFEWRGETVEFSFRAANVPFRTWNGLDSRSLMIRVEAMHDYLVDGLVAWGIEEPVLEDDPADPDGPQVPVMQSADPEQPDAEPVPVMQTAPITRGLITSFSMEFVSEFVGAVHKSLNPNLESSTASNATSLRVVRPANSRNGTRSSASRSGGRARRPGA